MLGVILSALWSQWTLLFAVVLIALYKWSTSTYDFFEKKGIEYETPVPFFGNFKSIMFQQESIFDVVKRIYLKYKDQKWSGIFEMRKPLLIIHDPEIIRKISIKDFEYFMNHRQILDGEHDKLFGNSLFNIKDQKWKDMRATLSPAFTGSKMRLMFDLIETVSKNAQEYLKDQQDSNQDGTDIEMRDFFTRFTNDVIATSAFGIEVNSLKDKNNYFYLMGKRAANFSGWAAVRFLFMTSFPRLAKIMNVQLFDEKFSQYFCNLVSDTLRERSARNIVRPDMINLLMEARKGLLQTTDDTLFNEVEGFATLQDTYEHTKTPKRDWSDDDIVAQCATFFVAGFDTSATLMCFCAQELMENPEAQEKLIEEIDRVRKELNGKPLTYEILHKMKYLDMVISETLRKWPPAVATDRVCSKPYSLIADDSNKVIQLYKDEFVWIPIVGLHHDPEYFPEPDKFEPERFSDENKGNIKPFTYLPFGTGPRNCIGSRFALMESKAIIFHLLSEFTIEVSSKSTIPPVLKPGAFHLATKDGTWVKLRPRVVAGLYEMRNPIHIINNPEIIKQIAIKDFDHFMNHRVLIDANVEPLFGNSLFSLKDHRWRDMRATLSPAFTGSKMRVMFQLVDECGRSANKYLKAEVTNSEGVEVNLKDFFTRFTNDVIATCAFGLKINSLAEKDNQFYHMSRKATNFSGFVAIKFFLLSSFRSIMTFLRIKLFDEKFSKYFYSLVLDTMEQRAAKGIVRNDMINIMMEARKGELRANDVGSKDSSEGFSVVEESSVGQKIAKNKLTDDEIVAQCFLFFVAGFETVSVLMCFCAHELAENPEIQRRLIEEVDETQEELNGKPITYDAIQKMKYLDMVISETLRKWPPAVATDRVCNKPYTIGDPKGENFKLSVGDVLQIPIVGLHYDPEFFPEPDKFDPERFNDENKDNIKPFTYMPFGIGPRNCIGSRFALMEAKAIIYHILTEFTFEISPKTQIPIELSSKGFQLQPKGGFWLNFKPRK